MIPPRIATFAICQLAACIYAIRHGGLPERLVAVMMGIAALVTAAIPYHPHNSFHIVETAGLLIDVLLLGGFVALAARADRFWPLWVAALQLLAIAIHGVRAYDATLLPIVYARFSGQIAYPMLILLAVGTLRHRQRVLARGPEADWSPLVWR